MVSTRAKGGPVLMLDDHENPVQQPTTSPGKPDEKSTKSKSEKTIEASPTKKSKSQSRKSMQGPPGDQPEDKATTTKGTRSTRSNPRPIENEVVILSEPERILQRRHSRNNMRASQASKTTVSEKDIFDLPSDDRKTQTASKDSRKVIKYKGKAVVMKVPNAEPTPTVEVEVIEQNQNVADGGNGELEATVEGHDGDDELDEEDVPDVDDTLGDGVGAEDVDGTPETEGVEEVPKELVRRRGRPPKEQRPGPNPSDARNPNGEKSQRKKKRRKDVGTYHGDHDDYSETEETKLRQMSSEEFGHKIVMRLTAMEQTLGITYSNLENERKSIERRLKAADYIMVETVKEFNGIGVYNGLSMRRDDPNRQTIVPKIFRGDPFPEDTTDFDGDHPAIQALFLGGRMAYEVDIFNGQLSSVEAGLEVANQLHHISEKIWLASVKYKTILQRQKHYLETCMDRAKSIKVEYIKGRQEESKRNKEAAEARAGRKMAFAIPERPHRRTEQVRGYAGRHSTDESTVSRKRGLESPNNIVSKRPRSNLEQGRPIRRYRSSAPESVSIQGPSTPPPTDRVIVELFGDHTPGRTRRIHRPPGASNDRGPGRSSGIHDDNAPWTPEENEALDTALQQITEPEGRWLLIKRDFGGPGTALAERSDHEICEKAREYKQRIENSGQELPAYWQNVGLPSSDEQEK
ncbi:hypothetical protein TWF718_004432 [Orbilia javanica]|uniref:Myb-like domain-containing protein n=1 Tax=Orbilia javanica TaxID=47235 RepID=A0AAN8RQB8_9PEZI